MQKVAMTPEILARVDEFTRELNKLKQMLGNKEAVAIPTTTTPIDSLLDAEKDQQQKQKKQKHLQKQLIKAAGRAAFYVTTRKRKRGR